MSIMLLFGILDFEPEQIIPISGMVIGNCMVLSLLFVNKFTDELENSEEMIELILSFGGSAEGRDFPQLKISDSNEYDTDNRITENNRPRTAAGYDERADHRGAPPMETVMYQLLILFLILTNATAASVMVGFLSYPKLFNRRMQYTGLKNE